MSADLKMECKYSQYHMMHQQITNTFAPFTVVWKEVSLSLV